MPIPLVKQKTGLRSSPKQNHGCWLDATVVLTQRGLRCAPRILALLSPNIRMWLEHKEFRPPPRAASLTLGPRRRRGWRARWRGRGGRTGTAGCAWSGCPWGTRCPRAPWCAGTHARATRTPGASWPTRTGDDQNPSPGPGRWAGRASGPEHPMGMVAMVVMPAEHGTGEEDHRHDENDPRDNHDPRRDLIEPARRCCVRLRRRSRCGSTRLSRRFG